MIYVSGKDPVDQVQLTPLPLPIPKMPKTNKRHASWPWPAPLIPATSPPPHADPQSLVSAILSAWKMSTTDVAAKPTLALKCKRCPPTQTHPRGLGNWKAAKRHAARMPGCPAVELPCQTKPSHAPMPCHAMPCRTPPVPPSYLVPQLEHSRKFQFFSHHCSLLCLRPSCSPPPSPSSYGLYHIVAMPLRSRQSFRKCYPSDVKAI